ncbi:MAG: MFS transporter [Solirubrobacterales bacterium]|nr:MFS transporter [Solirubrobacterales bacterium]
MLRPGRWVHHEGLGRPTALRTVSSNLPERLDRLPWSRWHWLVVLGLGITWVLDGLSVTIIGAIGPRLEHGDTLGLSVSDVASLGSIYIGGAVVGALGFGWLTDRIGRKRLFLVTLGVYIVGTVLSGLAWDFWSLAVFRLITGMGIGGEYSAINSAIDELIPARVRGRVDLTINGSYWIGAAVGALASLLLLDTAIFGVDLGWRLAFLLGALLAFVILFVRARIPESPRWLLIHGREREAADVVTGIEAQVIESTDLERLPEPRGEVLIQQRDHTPLREVLQTMFVTYRRRTLLGFSMMVSQAFFYNAIFFTYGLVLTEFFDVSSSKVGLYLVPFAIGNFLGPLLLGRLFDSVGRRPMIAGTYALSAIALLVTGVLFKSGDLTATTQTLCWMVAFFFASAAASSAYLTVSEIFPIETRGLAIAVFYALGTAVGGISGPLLFGHLIESGSADNVFIGYAIGAGLMLVAAAIAAVIAVPAERRSLEAVATPLSAVDPDEPGSGEPRP